MVVVRARKATSLRSEKLGELLMVQLFMVVYTLASPAGMELV